MYYVRLTGELPGWIRRPSGLIFDKQKKCLVWALWMRKSLKESGLHEEVIPLVKFILVRKKLDLN